MNTWTLVIYFGISWAGAAGWTKGHYPDEAACYKALAALRFNEAAPNESDKRRSTFAYCRPSNSEDRGSK